VLDMMKGYLQLAAGLGDLSRRKAMDLARELVDGAPVAGLRGGAGSGTEALGGSVASVAAVADELMAIGRQNRRLLVQLVRTETEAVLASVGARPERAAATDRGMERLDDQLRALRERVGELERQLRDRASGPGTVTAGRTATTTAKGTASTTVERTTKRAATRTAKGAATRATKATTAKGAATRATKATTAKRATKAAVPTSGRRRAAGPTS
jgi:hypothetical protein